jgi:bifunctional DNA-binding transcriptional regulator/antitoxin component of YhaV-PrlF toxin-antitoxin module
MLDFDGARRRIVRTGDTVSDFLIMEKAMHQVRVRDRHQITLPASIARAANINPNDVLSVSYKEGVVTLLTQSVVAKKRPSLMDFAGSANGLYGRTTEEIDAYIANERKSWER